MSIPIEDVVRGLARFFGTTPEFESNLKERP